MTPGNRMIAGTKLAMEDQPRMLIKEPLEVECRKFYVWYANVEAHGHLGSCPGYALLIWAAPLCAKECWACVAQRSTEPEHCQGGDGVLRDVRGLRCGGWWPAAVSRGCAAAGAASAAHCGADRRPCDFGPVAPRTLCRRW